MVKKCWSLGWPGMPELQAAQRPSEMRRNQPGIFRSLRSVGKIPNTGLEWKKATFAGVSPGGGSDAGAECATGSRSHRNMSRNVLLRS